jgi:N4-gp56 family major capsid protein
MSGIQTYSAVPSRNLIKAERQMLKHAEPIMVLSNFGSQKEMPENQTDTLVFRRALPLDSAANGAPDITVNNYLLQEGATPGSRTINYQDVSVTLQQYGVLLKITSKTERLYEDDVPGDMVKLVGEHMGSLAELINFGVCRAGTNVLYTNGASRAAVNTAITLNSMRRAARILEAAHAGRVTQRLAPGVNFGTAAVAPAYLVFCHTDVEADVRNLPGFVPVEEYGTFKPAHDREVGKVEQFRIVTSPYFKPFAAAGSGTLNGMLGTGNVDVYPVLVVAEEAWGQVALKGQGAVRPTYLPAKQKNHANPMGMFGYVGAEFWKSAVRLNENWMVRIECGATSL